MLPGFVLSLVHCPCVLAVTGVVNKYIDIAECADPLKESWPQEIDIAEMSTLQENAFLHKLWTMLDPSREDNSNILCWDREGDKFHVLDIQAMETHILPRYFRHSKFSSFQRQLNYFGFKKVGKGKVGSPFYILLFSHVYILKEGSVYVHPLFNRSKPEDCSKIKRKTKRKKKAGRAIDDQYFQELELGGIRSSSPWLHILTHFLCDFRFGFY